MRRVVSVLLASTFLIALATPVAAQTPIDERRVRESVPLGAFDLTTEPEIGCGDFAVLVEDIAGEIRPDGTAKVIARNDTLIWGLEPAAIGLADGVWLIDKGRLILEHDAEGGVASAELREGETIDVCALLR